MLLGWYLRRAVPWTTLLGCCAGGLLAVTALALWPRTAGALLPGLVACCAAAAAFCFDEVALPVVEVSPRGGAWRRTARLAATLVPLALWTVTVLLRPGDLPLDREPWLLVGVAVVGLTGGLAALASRHGIAAPGPALAAVVVIAATSPGILGGFLDWESPYPLGEFGRGPLTFWLAVATVGLIVCALALRPVGHAHTRFGILGRCSPSSSTPPGRSATPPPRPT